MRNKDIKLIIYLLIGTVTYSITTSFLLALFLNKKIPISINIEKLGNFGDFLSGIVSAGALLLLYKTLKSQIAATLYTAKQLELSQLTTKIESLNKYLSNPDLKETDNYKKVAAELIFKDLTENIFQSEEYAKYYRPAFFIMNKLPFESVFIPNGYKQISLFLEICPIVNLKIDSSDCEIMNHDKELNVGDGIIVLVPYDTLEHKFTLYYTSSFGNHNWCQTFSIYFENTEFEPVLLSKSK